MLAFDLVRLLDPDVLPERSKIHLATWNGSEDPLVLFRSGAFEPWQASQNNRNFERDFVVALIAMPERASWLMGGVYQRTGCVPAGGERSNAVIYDLAARPKCEELKGRLVCTFERKGRQPYLLAEAWVEGIRVSELLAERLSVEEFPGFRAVHLRRMDLAAIVRHQVASWRAALSSVGGVYLITDERAGLLYVGSAYGEGGLWQRWSTYAANGHGGDRELRKLLQTEGRDRVDALHYSILETTDVGTKPEDVIRRESHWKRVLGSRARGLNAN
jgi:hypothetical protein